MPRSRLGPLAIETKLGDHPSQSCVWRAIHVQLKRAVAVKVFATPFGGTPEARAEFASEWATLKSLQHPAIAKCYGGGFEQTDAYLAYELIEGESLSAQLQRRTRLSWEAVLDMSEPLIEALAYLHKLGIIYGAIQPDKILFAGLSPVLVDVRTQRTGTGYRTQRPPTPDELKLLPPELLIDPSALSPQTDLYMLGATLYLAVTGRPPVNGETIEEITANIANVDPPAPASLVMECPVWFDKLIMQLLQKNPAARPNSAQAVKLALAEVRRRSMSRTGVAEHASSGFSPLTVTSQDDREVARRLLGRDSLDFDDDAPVHDVAWHDRPFVLIAGLLLIVGAFAWVIWPLNEDQMRERAEDLLKVETRTSMMQAKNSYLKPMLDRYPEGRHASWAEEQIERVEMKQAEHALEVKLNRNLPLKDEAERLYAEANQFERFGDTATALDQYRSMVTLLGDDPNYRPFVNLARRQIGKIESEGVDIDEASRMIQAKLDEADQLLADGKVIPARKIWYSVLELYGSNEKVAPLVAKAQDRLEGRAEKTTPSLPQVENDPNMTNATAP
ncbi:Serine/threonine-protein kinase PK-1 [Rubripirellula amarantea]|uniref:Serine/threonine-protein kinase PK-1 n=1 Tax=Rubripirellula amarantea TaxID=2527999 RepID=A0A5C5WTD4_9BACT|nr:serine/threonine-protein kinase [Rubripirellula amarantea]TWT53439.1 Serine/threonine-protein kinase PK-1 [Rubripirellula amarantea]